MSDWTDGLDDGWILAIWNACAPPRTKDMRGDLLTSTSRHAIHYGLGGEIHELTCVTVGLKAGLRLGFIKATGSGAEKELDNDSPPVGPDPISLQ